MATHLSIPREEVLIETELMPVSQSTASVIEEVVATNQLSRSSLIRTKIQLSATLFALFLSLFLAALDFSIATTATPTIVNELHSSTLYTWIGSAYLLASAAATPIWAKLSDIWGRKAILLASVTAFAIGSAICASATNMASLVAGRSIQGAGAGGMIILTNIVISDLFSMRQRGFYLGLVGVVWSLAGGVGPLIGGAFAQYVSWRWIWWSALPISALSFFILCVCLHVHNPRTNILQGIKAVDWIGTFLILGTSLMILIGLNIGGIITPWGSPKVICLIVIGAVVCMVFALYEARFANNPLMPMQILRKRSNIAAILVVFMHGFVNVSSWYFLPLYFQSVKQASPIRSGLLILPITCLQSGVSVAAGAFINRTGRYLELIWIGMGITSLGYGLFIKLDTSTSLVEVVALEIVAGIGVGLVFQPPLIALQALVEPDDAAAATALLGFMRSLSTAISIVIGGVIFQGQMQKKYVHLLAVLPADVASLFAGNGAAANVQLIGTLTLPQQAVVKEAYSQSLRSMWVLYAAVAVLGLVISSFISRQQLSREHVEIRTGLVKKDGDAVTPVVLE